MRLMPRHLKKDIQYLRVGKYDRLTMNQARALVRSFDRGQGVQLSQHARQAQDKIRNAVYWHEEYISSVKKHWNAEATPAAKDQT